MTEAKAHESFFREWNDVTERVHRKCHDTLARIGVSERGLAYVDHFQGVAKFPYLVTAWIPDSSLRMALGVHAGVHCVGIKLIDDLLDCDQPYDSWDLGPGVYLVQMATCEMGQYHNSKEVLEIHRHDFDLIWKAQIGEARRPPATPDEWLQCARLKSGRLLATYGAAASLAANIPEAVQPSRIVGECIGTLVMIADDLVDHAKLGQTRGNLGSFLKDGTVSCEHVASMIEELRQTAFRALEISRTAHDIGFFINILADDVLQNYLRKFCA